MAIKGTKPTNPDDLLREVTRETFETCPGIETGDGGRISCDYPNDAKTFGFPCPWHTAITRALAVAGKVAHAEAFETVIDMLIGPGRHFPAWDGGWTEEVIAQLKQHLAEERDRLLRELSAVSK